MKAKMKRNRDGKYITLVLEINDEEKFRKFHGMVLGCENHSNSKEEIGASAVYSGWGDKLEDVETLERVVDFAMDNLAGEDGDIAELMLKDSLTVEEAQERLENEV